MPILERDPWRFQFFAHVKCPDDVNIPTDDPDCWELFPAQRWVYNKLTIAQSQGLPCGVYGIAPTTFPVFSKPTINLKGMGLASARINNIEELAQHEQPGHMWMQFLTGDHISTDCAVVAGEVCWLRHAKGETSVGGMFQYWTIETELNNTLEQMISKWVQQHMAGYTGMMNFETIGGGIIEAHLRFADQWCDLYGQGWVEALIKLYAEQKWGFDDSGRQVGYSVPLFAKHGRKFYHPPDAVQTRIKNLPDVTSLQITFHEEKTSASHPMPPGGFRLGIINATDLNAGFVARDELARAFPFAEILR